MEQAKFIEIAKAYLNDRKKDIEKCISEGLKFEDCLGVWYELPTDKTAGYLCYQISYGGPSDEIRFYSKQGETPYLIEYVYLDWFSGIGFEVTKEEWAKWLWEQIYTAGIYDEEKRKAYIYK